jgi:hypothetical protein
VVELNPVEINMGVYHHKLENNPNHFGYTFTESPLFFSPLPLSLSRKIMCGQNSEYLDVFAESSYVMWVKQ